jgi:hypothetical protein
VRARTSAPLIMRVVRSTTTAGAKDAPLKADLSLRSG